MISSGSFGSPEKPLSLVEQVVQRFIPFPHVPHHGLGGAKQHTFSYGRTLKAGFGNQFCIRKANFFKQGQEILSWYGPALSLEPAINPGFRIVRQRACQDLIGHHQPTPGLQDPKYFCKRLGFIGDKIKHPIREHDVEAFVRERQVF